MFNYVQEYMTSFGIIYPNKQDVNVFIEINLSIKRLLFTNIYINFFRVEISVSCPGGIGGVEGGNLSEHSRGELSCNSFRVLNF